MPPWFSLAEPDSKLRVTGPQTAAGAERLGQNSTFALLRTGHLLVGDPLSWPELTMIRFRWLGRAQGVVAEYVRSPCAIALILPSGRFLRVRIIPTEFIIFQGCIIFLYPKDKVFDLRQVRSKADRLKSSLSRKGMRFYTSPARGGAPGEG